MLFPSSSQPNSPRCWSRRQANPSSCRQRRPQEARRTQTQTPPFWQSQARRQRSACPGCCPSASSHGGDGGDLSTEGGALSRSAPKHPAHKKPGSPPNINAEVSSDGAGQGFSRVSLPNHHSSHLDHIQPLPDLRDSTQSQLAQLPWHLRPPAPEICRLIPEGTAHRGSLSELLSQITS